MRGSVTHHGVGRRVLAAALAVAVLAAPAAGQRRRPRRVRGKPSPALPVSEVVRKGLGYLYSQQGKDGRFASKHGKDYPGGCEALAALTLLRAGESPKDERLVRTLRYLKSVQPQRTYTRCLRTMVYSMLDDADSRRRMAKDVSWLLKQQQRNGGWGYGPGSPMTQIAPDWTDGSNSQFALLALREATDAGATVPLRTWRQAEAYWRSSQAKDGGWGYQAPGGDRPPQRAASHGSMTAAGVASYFILAGKFPQGPGNLPYRKQLAAGTGWLEKNYGVQKVPKYVWLPQPSQLYYYLFCLARVGDAAGAGKIGAHDYAREIADLLGRKQDGNGAWENAAVDTALALLTLMKINAPAALARLEFAGKPGAAPRDAANVARWLSRRLRRPVGWRLLSGGETIDPGRCSVLYINADPKADRPKDLDKNVAAFVRDGGTLLVQAPSVEAASDLADWCRRILPNSRTFTPPDDHPIFNLRFKVDPARRPKLLAVGDGSRTLAVICPDDVARGWHKGRFKLDQHVFALAGNIVLYAGGGKLPPGWLEPPARRIRAVPPPARRFLKVARLKHGGDFGACPTAIKRLSQRLVQSFSTALTEAPPVDAGGAIDPSIKVLWLTGTKLPRLPKQHLPNLLAYLNAGGTLLIVPAGAGDEFRNAAVDLLEDLFGAGKLATSRADSPLVTGRFAGGLGTDLTKPPPAPTFRGGWVGERIAALLCPDGLGRQLEGPPGSPQAERARMLALNVILYAVTYGQRPPGGQP